MNKKDIILEIQKLAAPPPDAPPTAAKPIGGYAPAKGGGGVVGAGNPAIKEMQVAMQELATEVMRDATSATMAAKPKDVALKEALEPVKNSKGAFNNFIAEQYIGSLPEEHKGVEWTTDNKVTTMPGKKLTQTDIYELDPVMNTLRRIGGAKQEFNVDGVWGPRTDNALKNMMGFAYALIQLEGDFGLINNVYPPGYLFSFRQLLSGYEFKNEKIDLPIEDQEKRALQIVKHLKAITKLYDHFRKQVTTRPEFRAVIEGRPFEKYNAQGSNKNAMSPAEMQYAKSDAVLPNVSYIAPGLKPNKLNYIPLSALTSKEEYLKWMMDHAGVPSEEMALSIFNKAIKPQIDAM